jgi:hypothetical protein
MLARIFLPFGQTRGGQVVVIPPVNADSTRYRTKDAHMTDNDNPGEGAKDPRLSRRLMVARVAGGGAAVASVIASEASAQRSVTDADPRDGAGQGRGSGGGQYRTNATDRDPNDGPGRGRGTGSSTGYTDRDPSDGPGRGRSGRTDSDPSDGPGRGRR